MINGIKTESIIYKSIPVTLASLLPSTDHQDMILPRTWTTRYGFHSFSTLLEHAAFSSLGH